MPYLLKQHELNHFVSVTEANRNLAEHFRFYDNIKSPEQIDTITQRMYNVFHESELLYSEPYHL